MVPMQPKDSFFHTPQDLSFLSTSMQQLKAVQQRLKDSKESLDYINPKSSGRNTCSADSGGGGGGSHVTLKIHCHGILLGVMLLYDTCRCVM